MGTQTPNKYFFQGHEAGLVDLYAQVRTDGVVTWALGCPFTVTVPAANTLLFVLKQTVPIFTADLTDTSRLGTDVGTGVTKTFDIDAQPFATWPNGTASVNLLSTFDTVVSTPTINASGYLQFYVQFYGSLMAKLAAVGSVSGSTITLDSTPDAANFFVGQYVTAVASDTYPVATFTMIVASIDTLIGTVTMTASIPGGITLGYSLFNASTLYTNVSVQTTTEITAS